MLQAGKDWTALNCSDIENEAAQTAINIFSPILFRKGENQRLEAKRLLFPMGLLLRIKTLFQGSKALPPDEIILNQETLILAKKICKEAKKGKKKPVSVRRGGVTQFF